eukprot:1241176-Amphidinium_carterae.1
MEPCNGGELQDALQEFETWISAGQRGGTRLLVYLSQLSTHLVCHQDRIDEVYRKGRGSFTEATSP